MSDKADGFTVFHARCGRKLGIYIAVIGEKYIGKTESFQGWNRSLQSDCSG